MRQSVIVVMELMKAADRPTSRHRVMCVVFLLGHLQLGLFFINEREHSICGKEVAELFGDKDPEHSEKESHSSLHTSPIYQVKVMGMDDVPLIE